MAVGIKIEGLQKTLARFDIKKFEPKVQAKFNKFGFRVELAAKQNAPVDEGHLKGAIFQDPGRLSVTVGCSVNYAAYLEFGTRKFAAEYVSTLPADWREVAARAKGGRGGTFEEMVLRITEWVRRKGLGTGFAGRIGVTGTYSVKSRIRTGSKNIQAQQNRQAAYAIALKILREGIPAQPYLYPAVNTNIPLLIKDLNAIKL